MLAWALLTHVSLIVVLVLAMDCVGAAGARPRPRHPALDKPAQTYDDLERSKPRQLIPTVVTRVNDRHLNNRDIDMSWPVEQTFHSSTSACGWWVACSAALPASRWWRGS